MGITILEANSETHFLQFSEIVKEYFVWLRGRYQDMQWLIDQVATVQSLENELNDLALKYSMPTGMAFIATVDGVLAGGGAWRNQPDGSCEMKRVFVRDNFKGIGVGKARVRSDKPTNFSFHVRLSDVPPSGKTVS